MHKLSLLIYLILAFSAPLIGQDMTGFFYDPRDGKEYETVFIEVELEGGGFVTHEWMTSNLNYPAEGSFCYKNYEEYCSTFGRLYPWKIATKVCPEGWHLSRDIEWEYLTKKYGGLGKSGPALKEGGESGLELQSAGFGEMDGAYIDVGVNGYYWKQKNSGSLDPGTITVHRGVDYVTDDEVDATHRNSIRCVKDY